MNKDFDQLWNKRRARQWASCPLSDEALAGMIKKAVESPRPAETEHVELTPKRIRLNSRIVGWTAAAACAALVALPISNRMRYTVDGVKVAKVSYNNQKVMMVCNNNCNANTVLASFDDYLKHI